MMAYVVIGMHKSGTTLVSGALDRSGITMVDGDEANASYDTGHKYERSLFRDINLELLGCTGDFSLAIDLYAPPKRSERLAAHARDLIAGLQRARKPWGFKDPRTTLTYGFWQPLLPRHSIVGVYRHPLEVWAHYRARTSDVLYLGRVFDHWIMYNSKLLEYVSQAAGPAILLNFEALRDDWRAWGRLRDFIGCEVADVRIAALRRSVADPAVPVPTRALWIMERLEALERGER